MTSRKRFSETEILQILAEAAERQATLPLLQKYGISATTLRRWRLEHAGSPIPPPPPPSVTGGVDEADASSSAEVVPAQFIDPETAPPTVSPSPHPSEPPAPPPVSAEVWRRPARPAGRMKRSPAPGPWSQWTVLGLLVGLVLVLSWARCQAIHRLILLIGPVGAFVAMIALVTPFSMLLVRQFRRAWWQSCLDRLREGNGLVLFLTIVTLIVLDLAVLTLPSLICYLGNLVRTLFGL